MEYLFCINDIPKTPSPRVTAPLWVVMLLYMLLYILLFFCNLLIYKLWELSISIGGLAIERNFWIFGASVILFHIPIVMLALVWRIM